MKHLRKLINESKSLTVFEMLTKLQAFLHEKYNIKAFGAKEDNGFVMYMSKYVTDEEGKHDTDLSEAIQNFVQKEFSLEAPIVHKDNYGYHIEFGLENKQSAKLIEVTQAQGTGMSDSKVSYKCHFCDNMEEGYGNDPWPLDTNPSHRVCEKCNEEMVIPARIERLLQKESKNESTEKSDVERAASNIILDDKFTWLFSVLDENGRDIEEGVEYLQDAIDLLIKDDAAFLVAFPYVDPKPGDPDVEFVFADNPGPVVIYNNEQVTIPKSELERPTSEKQPKPEDEDEEEVIEEAMGDNILVHVFDIVIPGVRLDDGGEFQFTVTDLGGIKFQIEEEIGRRYDVRLEDIETYDFEVLEYELEEAFEEAMSDKEYYDNVERIKRQIDDLRDKNSEIRKGRMSGSEHRNRKRIKELEDKLRRLRKTSREESEEVEGNVLEEAQRPTFVLTFTGHMGMSGPIYKDINSEIYFEDINALEPYDDNALIAILSPKNDPDGEPNFTIGKDEYVFDPNATDEPFSENVHRGTSDERRETYLLNALELIEELTGYEMSYIKEEIVGDMGTTKVQLENALEYLQEITNEKMKAIEDMIGAPHGLYLELALDESELKTEDYDSEEIEEGYYENEETESGHKLIIKFTTDWYDHVSETLDDYEDEGKALVDAVRDTSVHLEDLLDSQGIIMGISEPYWFGTNHDLESTTEATLEELREAKDIVEYFLGSWAIVRVVSK